MFVFILVFIFIQANINGRVLAQCNIDELKKEMSMNFGDWHLFRSTVRYFMFIELFIILYEATAIITGPNCYVYVFLKIL